MSMPAFILCRPQMGENIGAAARVMANFGFNDLRLVDPRDGWPNSKAYDMAKHAKPILDDVSIHNKLGDAFHGVDIVYATSARPRDMIKPIYTPKEASLMIQQDHQEKMLSAVVFGCERSGLTNHEISYANAVLEIPTDARYPSLNLAQSVAILAYEFAREQQISNPSPMKALSKDWASKQEINDFIDQWINYLDHSDFFRVPEKRKTMIDNIRNSFTRQRFTFQEIQTLRGALKAMDRT